MKITIWGEDYEAWYDYLFLYSWLGQSIALTYSLNRLWFKPVILIILQLSFEYLAARSIRKALKEKGIRL